MLQMLDAFGELVVLEVAKRDLRHYLGSLIASFSMMLDLEV